jgi:hypothetical protein
MTPRFAIYGTPCVFEGCTRPKSGGGPDDGLCRSHYLQKRAGKVLTPLRKLGPDRKARAKEDADTWMASVRARKAAQ